MTSAIEKIDATTVKITVTLTHAELAPAIEHAYGHMSEGLTLPGFRKGKVPPAMARKQIGWGPALEHAVNEGLAQWYSEAIEEHDLRPISRPDIDLTSIPTEEGSDEGLAFVATVEVRPEVTLPKLESVTVKVAAVEVEESLVDERLDALRARFGTLVGVDRPAAHDDFVTIDLAAVLDGAEVDAVQGTSYQVGSGNMLDGLDEAVSGLSAGEETTYEGPLAAGDHAGAVALIRVKVTAVKERELPAADDEFAQLASEFDTIGELRDDLRAQAGRVQVNNQAVEARAKLLDHLKEAVTFELPGKVIEREVHEHLERESRLDDDVHRKEVTEEAEEGLRHQILLDQLADDLNIEVEEEELVDYLINMSRQYGMDPEPFIAQVQQSGRIGQYVADVARQKATAYALRKVTVKDSKGAVVDLTDIVGSEEMDAVAAKMRDQIRAERTAAAKASTKKAPAKKPAAKKPAAKKAAPKKK